MHGNEIIYALICTKNHVLLCQYSMLSTIATVDRDDLFIGRLISISVFIKTVLRDEEHVRGFS